VSNFLANLARRGAGIVPTIVPRAPYGSETPAFRPEAPDTPDAPDNPAPGGNAATLDTPDRSKVHAAAADPFEVDTSRSSRPRNDPPPNRTRVSSEVPTRPSIAPPDDRRTFESRPSASSPIEPPAPGDRASFADPSEPDTRHAGEPSRPLTAVAPTATTMLRPSRSIEPMAAAKHHPPSPSDARAAASTEESAARLAPSPRSAEVMPVAQADRKSRGEHPDPTPARTEAPSIRVTIGRVDIRASSPPQAPRRSSSAKESRGFAELRLSRSHLGRTHV
jgi:hypothetical protein